MRRSLLFLLLLVINFNFNCRIVDVHLENKENKFKVWFAPNLKSRDYLSLFKDEKDIFRKIDVFKFYVQQITDEDYFKKLIEVDAFNVLRTYNVEIAIEAGAIKEYSCREPLILDTDIALYKLSNLSVPVSYISIDSAYLSGFFHCNNSLEESRDIIKSYINYFKGKGLKIGLIEPYPHFSIDELTSFVSSLDGIDHLHIDLDFNAVKDRGISLDKLYWDISSLADLANKKDFRLGIIYTGSSIASDSCLFMNSLYNYWDWSSQIRSINGIGDIIIQSWLKDLPYNTPSTDRCAFLYFFRYIL